MVIGCVPFLRRLVFTSDAPLYFLTDSCTILRDAMIPSILLALGGNLVDGKLTFSLVMSQFFNMSCYGSQVHLSSKSEGSRKVQFQDRKHHTMTTISEINKIPTLDI